jgi:hypothetical protein
MRHLSRKYTQSSILSAASINRLGRIQGRGFKTSSVLLGKVPQQPTVDHGYLPNSTSPITTNLDFFDAVTDQVIPAYRVLDGNGQVLEGAQVPEVSK